MTKLLGTDALYDMACDAEDMNKDVLVVRSEIDDDVIVYIEIDDETYWNDLFDEEMDDTNRREADRYYYG